MLHTDSLGNQTILDTTQLNCMVELHPGLWMSGEPGTEWGPTSSQITENGIDVIVNLWGRGMAPMQMGMMFIMWLIQDEEALPNTTDLERLSAFLAHIIKSGKKVLIHCQGGLNRSGLVAARVLMHLEELDGNQAISRIRERRGEFALFRQSFIDYIIEKDRLE